MPTTIPITELNTVYRHTIEIPDLNCIAVQIMTKVELISTHEGIDVSDNDTDDLKYFTGGSDNEISVAMELRRHITPGERFTFTLLISNDKQFSDSFTYDRTLDFEYMCEVPDSVVFNGVFGTYLVV